MSTFLDKLVSMTETEEFKNSSLINEQPVLDDNKNYGEMLSILKTEIANIGLPDCEFPNFSFAYIKESAFYGDGSDQLRYNTPNRKVGYFKVVIPEIPNLKLYARIDLEDKDNNKIMSDGMISMRITSPSDLLRLDEVKKAVKKYKKEK